MKLKYNFGIPVIIVLFFAFLSFIFYLIYDQQKIGERELLEKAKQTSKLIAQSNEVAVWRFDKEYITKNCNSFLKDNEVIKIKITDTTGILNLVYEKPGFYSDTIDVTHLVKRENKKIGIVSLSITKHYLYERIAGIRNKFIILFFLIITTISIILYFITNKVVSPIERLIVITNKYSKGDLQVRSKIKSKNEIGDLASAFNHMAETLNMSFQEIQDYSENLEAKVEKRTNELNKTNAQLQETVTKLKSALSQVTTLSGLLPICSNCKKIRNDQGFWEQVESYIENHSEAEFSHSLCQDCADKLYGEEDWYKKEQDSSDENK